MRQAGRDVVDRAKVDRACQLLGWGQENINAALKDCRSVEDAQVALERLKAEIKVNFRILARALTPDRGGDPDDIRHVNLVWAQIKDKKLVARRRPPPRPMVQHVVIVQGYGGTSYTNSSTTTSSTGWGGFGGW